MKCIDRYGYISDVKQAKCDSYLLRWSVSDVESIAGVQSKQLQV